MNSQKSWCSIFAGKLALAGNNVTVLACSKRYVQIEKNSIARSQTERLKANAIAMLKKVERTGFTDVFIKYGE